MKPVYDPEQEELYHIAGHAGPGVRKGDKVQGMSSTLNFAAGSRDHELQFRYEDKIIFADLYLAKDGSEMYLHWICPKCGHASRISSTKKEMHWDGKLMSVAPFECPWELSDEREAPPKASAQSSQTPLILVSSNNLCRLKLAIDRGVLRRA